MSERWEPRVDDRYYYVNTNGVVDSARWDNDGFDYACYEHGNCFLIKDEAQAAAEKVRELLLSLHGPATDCTQLPKLTVDVFDRPDCPEWAKYAAVDENGDASFFEKMPYQSIKTCGCFLRDCLDEIIPGKFDPSDWENSLIERPDKKPKRPDWMKYEKWFYFRGRYAKLFQVYEEQNIVSLDFYDGNRARYSLQEVYVEAVESRLRPFNTKEMKALVGQVLAADYGVFLVNKFEGGEVCVDGSYYDADRLLNEFTINGGNPCGKLEHLNEKGEWVE